MEEELTRKDAIEYLGIPEKDFENYFKYSKEITGYRKPNGRWYFNKNLLDVWNNSRSERTVILTMEEYEKCFEFAIKMVYGGLSLNGIRGQRTEVQGADDVIFGVLAEHAIKKFLFEKFETEIKLDEEVHPETITPQDFDMVKDGTSFRVPHIGVGVKASKMKNAFLILGENEVEIDTRKSDVYIFARIGLPSDHLFRILGNHSFFGRVKKFLDENENFKKIESLNSIPVWICGYTLLDELERVTEIPGQKFTGAGNEPGYRYVKNVKDMHNSDEKWREFIGLL